MHHAGHSLHTLNTTVYCLAEAASHDNAGGVMAVLGEIWAESRRTHDMVSACTHEWDAIVGLQKPEYIKEIKANKTDALDPHSSAE